MSTLGRRGSVLRICISHYPAKGERRALSFVKASLKRNDTVAFQTTEGGKQVVKIGIICFVGPVKFFRRVFKLDTTSTRRHAVVKCGAAFYVKQLTSLMDPASVK